MCGKYEAGYQDHWRTEPPQASSSFLPFAEDKSLESLKAARPGDRGAAELRSTPGTLGAKTGQEPRRKLGAGT